MSLPPEDAARVLQSFAPPAPEVAPTLQLPEDIDPGSFEARLWHENQEMRRQIAEISGAVKQQSLSRSSNSGHRLKRPTPSDLSPVATRASYPKRTSRRSANTPVRPDSREHWQILPSTRAISRALTNEHSKTRCGRTRTFAPVSWPHQPNPLSRQGRRPQASNASAR